MRIGAISGLLDITWSYRTWHRPRDSLLGALRSFRARNTALLGGSATASTPDSRRLGGARTTRPAVVEPAATNPCSSPAERTAASGRGARRARADETIRTASSRSSREPACPDEAGRAASPGDCSCPSAIHRVPARVLATNSASSGCEWASSPPGCSWQITPLCGAATIATKDSSTVRAKPRLGILGPLMGAVGGLIPPEFFLTRPGRRRSPGPLTRP